MPRNIEVLAPAGDYESFTFALGFGANAVYLGAKEFGMRSSSANFSMEEMEQAVKQAHSAGKRVYLTLNTLPTNEEAARMPQLIYDTQTIGIDALIIADLGVLSLAKKYAPGVEVHFSTQGGVTNYVTANALYEMGVSRVVLARELSVTDIAEIRRNIPRTMELEVFVHGAMCMSVSGRCFMSSHMIGRDANRGKCAQPCRWKYQLVEEKRPGQYMEVGGDEEGSYILSADDLCAAPFIDKVIEAGATSLKIEGRAKSFYYVASTTAAYRAAVDAALKAPKGKYEIPQFAKTELERTSHRPYSSGFLLGPQGATQSPGQEGYIRTWQPVGVVYAQQNGRVFFVQRGKFTLGEKLEALIPPGRVVSFTPENIMNADGEIVESTAQTKQVFSVPQIKGQELPVGTILRRKMS